MSQEDPIDYPKRIRKGLSPEVAPVEAVEAPGRKGFTEDVYRQEDLCYRYCYPNRVEQSPSPGVVFAEVA